MVHASHRARCARFSDVRGFSLPETLVVLAIVAVLAAMAGPALTHTIASYRLRLATDAVVRALTLTRSEAIKRNARVVICKSRDGSSCDSTAKWEMGWLIFQDNNNDSRTSPGDVMVYRQGAVGTRLVVADNGPLASFVSYTPNGTARHPSGAMQMGRLTLCERSNSATEAREVVLGSVGRPRVTRIQVPRCPAKASETTD